MGLCGEKCCSRDVEEMVKPEMVADEQN